MNGAATTRLRRFAWAAAVGGLLALALGVWFQPEQFYESYLFAFVFWLSLSLGALVVSMISQLTGGRWGRMVAGPALVAAGALPLLLVLYVPLLFGLDHLYPWLLGMGAEEKLLRHKEPFLNLGFFLVRTAVYLVVWAVVSVWFGKRLLHALEHDRPQDWRRVRRASAIGLLLYTITGTLAAFDWIMSLLPMWYSTVFGAEVLVMQLLTATALLVLALGRIRTPAQPMPEAQDYHDLGNLMLMFTLLWAYLAYSDFLTIWIADLAHETEWYRQRALPAWRVLAVAVWVLQFGLPFVALLFRAVKRNAAALRALAAAVLFGGLLNCYWLIMPSLRQHSHLLSWLDVAAPVALGGVWVLVFLARSRRIEYRRQDGPGGVSVQT